MGKTLIVEGNVPEETTEPAYKVLPTIDSDGYAKFTRQLGGKAVDDGYVKETAKELEAKYVKLMEQISGTEESKGFWASIFEKSPKAQRDSFEARIGSFLSGYENKLAKLQNVIKIIEEQGTGITEWLGKFEESIEGVEVGELNGLEQIEYAERQKIIATQKLSLKRCGIRITDAKGTNLIMSNSLNRYRTDLSLAITEIGMARVLDSALTTLGVFEKISGDTQDRLTEDTIQSNKNTISTCQRVLTSDSATRNTLKLGGAVDSLETLSLNAGR